MADTALIARTYNSWGKDKEQDFLAGVWISKKAKTGQTTVYAATCTPAFLG